MNVAVMANDELAKSVSFSHISAASYDERIQALRIFCLGEGTNGKKK